MYLKLIYLNKRVRYTELMALQNTMYSVVLVVFNSVQALNANPVFTHYLAQSKWLT